MQKTKVIVVLAFALIMAAGFATATEKSSVEFGKTLFNDATLGGSTNGKSCNSCHPDGSGLENAGGKNDLVKMINTCITGPLEGEKIDGRTVAMRSLKMYIESLSGK